LAEARPVIAMRRRRAPQADATRGQAGRRAGQRRCSGILHHRGCVAAMGACPRRRKSGAGRDLVHSFPDRSPATLRRLSEAIAAQHRLSRILRHPAGPQLAPALPAAADRC